MYEKTEKFIELYGEDIIQEIFECCWNNENSDHIFILERTMLNALNYVFSGYFIFNNEEICFDAESGNNSGDRILRFGDEAIGIDDIKPPRYIFKPSLENELKPYAVTIFNEWKKQRWFIEKQNDMNYDFMFSPTVKIRKHYSDWANKKGLMIDIE